MASLACIAVVGIATAVWLETSTVEAQQEVTPSRVNAVAILAEASTRNLDGAPLTAAVESIATTFGHRVRILGEDGDVLADAGGGGYACTPEDDPGVVTRADASGDWDGWLAVAADPAGGRSVCVTAEPTGLRAAVDSIRIAAMALALLVVLIAVFMSRYASMLVARRLDGLISEQRARDRLQTVLESMKDAVLAVNASLEVTLMNSAARELLRTESESTGEPLANVTRSQELGALAARGCEELAEDEFELHGTRVIGRAAPLEAGGTVINLSDVTKLRRLERVRKDFVANVSHELRTPVAVIRANAETLLDGALEQPDFASRFLDGIHRNSERLAALLDDLLDLARIEAGRYELTLEPIALQAAALAAVADLGDVPGQRGTSLEVDVDEALEVEADTNALAQILENLLGNAVKYTPEGSRVTVTAARVGGHVRLMVADDGPGIGPKHRERIFERFYRVDKGRSREAGGTGLGLAIVKHLVEQMSGRVWAEDNTPRGARFCVELPPP